MSDRKFTLEPNEMERLKTLMKEAEARLDEAEPSDEELAALERDLESRLRKVAAKQKVDQILVPPEGIERNWQAIQDKIQSSSRRGETREEAAAVIPIKQKRVQPFVWMGALAAAAITLLVVVPGMQKQEDPGLPQFVEKGNTPAFSADCEIDARAADGSADITVSDDRMGFEGPVGTAVRLSIRCSHDGFLQIAAPGQAGLRNVVVASGINQDVMSSEGAFQPLIREGASFILSFMLTEQVLADQVEVPTSEAEAERLENTKVLWFDTMELKGKQK